MKTEDTTSGKGRSGYLSDEEKNLCLKIARRSIESYLRGEKTPDFKEELTENLKKDGAAFVSLHERNDLRGCVGQIEAREPLWICIREMAVAAATQDTRFSSVREEEVDALEIEISVLTPMEEVRNPLDIKVGRDGLMVTKGYHRGLLLPQVATDYMWTREEFLDHTCIKAGLPPETWRSPGLRIQKFQALVFQETPPAFRT